MPPFPPSSLLCFPSLVVSEAFFVNTTFSTSLTTGITCIPLTNFDYDVIVKTSDLAGTGTVSGWKVWKV
jgi:hypothetical protein